MREFLAVHATTNGTYRHEVLSGAQYIVVPVVALVEGVIQGITAEVPELALSAEFGKYVTAWNGRPITMDHPWILNPESDGKNPNDIVRVSASLIPEILDTFQVGYIFNTRLVGSKLAMEAWIDPTRLSATAQGKTILRKIKAGEPIEVSTGLFTSAEMSPGQYNGKSYQNVWRGVVPDHLALLPEGTVGACSVQDGCGANVTIHQQQNQPQSTSHQTTPTPTQTPNTPSEMRVHRLTSGQNSCACGGTCGGHGTHSPQPSTAQLPTHQAQEPKMTTPNAQPGIPATPAAATPTDAAAALNTPASPAASATPVTNNQQAQQPAQPTPQPTAASASPASAPAPSLAQSTPKVLSAEEYLAQAPPSIREAIVSGMRMHAEHKSRLIKQLTDLQTRCRFSAEQLNSMDVTHLENLVELAKVPADFSGMAPAAGALHAHSQPKVNEGDLDYAAPPPRLGIVKPAKPAA